MRLPLASYKAALRAVKAYRRGNDTDAAALEAFAACIDALRRQHPTLRQLTEGWDGGGHHDQQLQQQQQPVQSQPTAVRHSFDLGLDDPGFLLSSALHGLALLRESRGEHAAASAALAAALAVFPSFVAARSAAALIAAAGAGCAKALKHAEALLRHAVADAAALAVAENGLVVASNRACAREVEAGAGARVALAMLLAQSGRDVEAAAHLEALGYRWRLGSGVLHYRLPGSPGGNSACAGTGACPCSPAGVAVPPKGLPLAVVDGGLPAPLLARLQAAFAPGAPFWREHGYGPRQGYFSYAFPLGPEPRTSLEQLARHLQALAVPHFPAVAEARFAEWWAHCRRHNSGHQLHFDSDDEGAGGVRNPIISSVCYLVSAGEGSPPEDAKPRPCKGAIAEAGGRSSSGRGSSGGGGGDGEEDKQGAGQCFVGGPTLVTDQRFGGALATKGWLAEPAVGRVTFFDGSVMHGVVPGRGPSPDPSARRCTLMVAFWRNLRCREPADGQLGAAMLMPQPPWPGLATTGSAPGATSWTQALELLPGAKGWGAAVAPRAVAPSTVSPVWEPVRVGLVAKAPSYDACFQGF